MIFGEQTDQEKETLPAITGPLLAVDVGTVNTRAVLLDAVDGTYRFVARGEAPTTATPPWHDVVEGVQRALHQVSEASGRTLLDRTETLIVPEQGAFEGINGFAVTASSGEPVRAILVGLVPDVSISSGRRAAETTYLVIEDVLSLGDSRDQAKQIDMLLSANPDLIVIVGGIDGGATQSLSHLVETVSVACSLIDEARRPDILFAGNTALHEEIREIFEDRLEMNVLYADNVRPTLNVEQLDSAQEQLAVLFRRYKSETGGFDVLGRWAEHSAPASGGVTPTAHSFGRVVRSISAMESADVLGVDLGSATTTIAASMRGDHYLNVFGNLGIGHSVRDLLVRVPPEHLQRWLVHPPERDDDISNYIWNKWLYPTTVPATFKSLEIEYAVAREVIRIAALGSRATWRGVQPYGLLPPFGIILLTGATLSKVPHPGWSALIVLDALQPVGVTRLLLDVHGLAVGLGALAPLNPTAIVQALGTGALLELGTMIAPLGRARRGEVVMHGTLIPEGVPPDEGREFEVRFGSIVRLPLAPGVKGELKFRLRRLSLEGEDELEVTGGELGVIIDARGRPWRFPRDPEQRLTALREWQSAMVEREGL
jgi:hypothetical protein